MANRKNVWTGTPYQYEAQDCPNRGRQMVWGDGVDGKHGDATVLYCRLCGAALRRGQYPEESRSHE